MKKFLLVAAAISVLSTAAFAANENSLQNGNTPDLVLPVNQNSNPPAMFKKKLNYAQSTANVESVQETGNVSDVQRILEKGGDNHDVSPY